MRNGRKATTASDPGEQYTTRLMAERAAAHDVRLSVGRTGSCHDNAVAEFIEAHCNRRRPHPAIGYEIPAERMAAFMERAERAFPEDEGAMPMAA